MKKWKYLFIIAVLLYSAWSVIPTVRYYAMSPSPETKEKLADSAIKLGLDLQGGMHLVLEVDDTNLSDDAKKDALDRTLRIIRNRVDQFGVSEPVIQKQGNRRIIVQLPGLQDAVRAKELIGTTAQLNFRLVRDDAELKQTLDALDRALEGVEPTETDIDSTAQSGEAGIDSDAPFADVADTLTEVAEDIEGAEAAFDSLIPELPGTEQLEVPVGQLREGQPFSSYLLTAYGGAVVVDERNKAAVDKLLATERGQRAMPPQSMFLWDAETRPLEGGGEGRLLYLVEKRATLSGGKLTNATTRPDPDDPSTLNIGFTLNREGAIIFSRFTGENIGRRIAIELDGKIQSAPVVQSKIPGGEGRITGQFTDEEANDLAIVLRAGALPAPVEIKEERTVGPTLGRDSIVLGVKAAVVGFGLVLIFMIIYYKASGILACMALILNLAIVLAVLAQLRAALTLPGIAGLILTIGMAVDANVLIFERIREELAKAKTVRSAIDSGYDRAFTTILDANITTLITAFVLWQFGTGPIKGFATVLSIGIVASMFTALLCTRVVFELISTRRQLRRLSI